MKLTKHISLTSILICSLFHLNAQTEVVNNDKRNPTTTSVFISDDYQLSAGLETSMAAFRRLQYQKVNSATKERTSYYIQGPIVNGERSMAHSWQKHGDFIYEVYMINKPKSLLLFQYGILKRDLETLEQVGELVVMGNDLEENFFKDNSIRISNKGIVSISYAKKHALLSTFDLDLNPTRTEVLTEMSNKTNWVYIDVLDENFFITYSNAEKKDIKRVKRGYLMNKEDVIGLYVDPLVPSKNFSMNLWLPETLVSTWSFYHLDAENRTVLGYFFTHDESNFHEGIPQKGNKVQTFLWDATGKVSEVSSIELNYETVLDEPGRKYIEDSGKKTYSTNKEEFPYILAAPTIEKRKDGSTHLMFNSLLENSSLYEFDFGVNDRGVNQIGQKKFKEEALKSCAYSMRFEDGQFISDHFTYAGQRLDLK